VYGEPEDVPIPAEAPKRPISPYGASKLMVEASNHAGHLATETALGKRPELIAPGTDYPTPAGSCLRVYVHVSDVASTHVAALAHLRSGGANAVLNIGYGYGHGSSVREVIAAVKQTAGRDFPVRIGPRRPGDPTRLIAAAARIRACLGWQPRHDDLPAIVAHALAWERRLENG
jgi:UDP-glucose 4-epimerase